MADNKVLLEFGANWDGVKRAAAGVKRSLKGIATTAKKTARLMATAFTKVGAMLKRLASNMMRWFKRAFIGIVAAIGGAIFASAKFEKQLKFVSTMLSDQNMPMLTKYRKELIAMSKDTGQATATLSKGLYDILSAGIDPEKATGVLGAGAKAAVAGGAETSEAVSAIITILNSYQMNAGKATEVSDKLFATVKRGRTTFGELASVLGSVAASAATAGLSFEEFMAMTSTMTRAGLNSFQSMTALKSVITAFLKPTDDAKAAAAQFGIELSSTTFKTEGLVSVMKKLQKATPEQIAQIFPNIRGMAGAAAVLKDVKGVTSDLTNVTDSWADETQKAWEKMADGVAFQFSRLKTQATATFIALGEPLQKPFEKVIAMIISGLASLEEWFVKNKATIQEWADWFVEKAQIVSNFIRAMFVGDNFYKSIKAAGEYILKAFGVIFRRVGSMLSAGLAAGMYEFRAKYMSDLADIFGLKNFVGKGMKRESEALRSKAAAALDEPTQGIGAELKDVWQNTIGKLNLSQSPVVAAVEAVKKEAAKTTKEQKKTNDLLSGKNPIAERTMSAFEQSVKEYQIKRLPKEQREKYLDKETSDADRASILEKYGKEPSKAMQRQLERKAFQASLFDKSREASQREQRERMGSLPNVSQKPAAVSGHTIQPVAPSMDTHMAEIKSNVESMIEKVAEIPEKISKATSSLANFMTAEESFTNKVYTTFQKVVQRLAKVEKRLASLKA